MFQARLVLQLEASVDGYEIVDSVLVDENYADEQFERCLSDLVRGKLARDRDLPANVTPGSRYRLEEPIRFFKKPG